MGFLLLGDSTLLDLNIGATGSADNVDMLWNVQGDTNIFDVDIGANYAPDNPNMDLTILGDRNDFRSAVSNQEHGVVLVLIGTIHPLFHKVVLRLTSVPQLGK